MDKFDRMQQLHRIFTSRTSPITIKELASKLECSEKTIKRGIDSLRDYVQAPLVYCSLQRGWSYNKQVASQFELPGLWLTSNEILGLAMILQLVQGMDTGLASADMAMIKSVVVTLLKSRKVPFALFEQKVRYLPKNKYSAKGQLIQSIGESLLSSRQLAIEYIDYSGQKTKRHVSPLKLVNYQENWYLDAWCHLRQELRSFMVARIATLEITNLAATAVSEEQQQQHYCSSYGIFAGEASHTAKLSFNATVATEAASLVWHPDQVSEWQDGNYLLSFPYNDDRELLRTILSYGDQVRVLGPAELQQKIILKARNIVAGYQPA